MAFLPDGILADFVKITKYPIKAYLQEYAEFVEAHEKNIYRYYSGKSATPNRTSFDKMNALIEKSATLENIIENKRDSFKSGAFWNLIETLSDIAISLETVSNASKWLRSAIAKNDFSPGVELEHTLRQLQTLEQVASDLESSADRDSDWIRIALRNDLTEEGYTTQGGNNLVIRGRNNATIRLRSVVDNISGKKVYGIDLHKKLQFVDDDLLPLSYDDTIRQTVEILANLRRGTTPEFPSDGYSVNGGNRKNMAFPILIRQMTATFSRDDTLRSFAIKNIEVRQDALFLTFEVGTRLGELIQTDVEL